MPRAILPESLHYCSTLQDYNNSGFYTGHPLVPEVIRTKFIGEVCERMLDLEQFWLPDYGVRPVYA